MKEALLYQKLANKKVLCLACQRKCTISDNAVGFCLARKNISGKLYSLLYGITTGIAIDPIEKKPFYHFKPGSLVATIGSIGCNFRCKQCLNSWCTWGKSATKALCKLSSQKQDSEIAINNPTPKQIAEEIINTNHNGVAFSYNEPVIWAEFAADIATKFKVQSFDGVYPEYNRGAQDKSAKCKVTKPFAVFVTNGSWTKETINLLSLSTASQSPITNHQSPLIDAANIDFKGFSEETYQKMGAFFGDIPQMAVYAQKKNIFLEITTLVVPTINDNIDEIKEMTNFIVHNLGPDTPWHLSEFDPKLSPDKEFQKIPFTPPELLQHFAEIGKNEGLNHIYIWAPHSGFFVSDTLCPKCKKVVIHRNGWQVQETNITPKALCKFCRYRLNVIL